MWSESFINKKKSRAFIAFAIFIVGILIIPNALIITGAADNLVIQPLQSDDDLNRIADTLEQKIQTNRGKTITDDPEQLDIIINFDHAPNKEDIDIIEQYGGRVYDTWDTILYAMHVSLPKDQVYKYVDNRKDVVLLQENNKINTTLEYSTQQIHARPTVWNNIDNIYPEGYTGDPNHAIAIIDTGIDDTHPDIAPRIIAWTDFIGEFNDDSTADIYLTPTDRHGHGTHCAGIAAGDGTAGGIQSNPGKLPLSYADYFYLQEGYGWWNYYPIDTTGGAASIDATLYWKIEVAGDEYYIWITNESGSGVGYIVGDTEPLLASTDADIPFGVQDIYRVIFGTIDNENPVNVNTNGTNHVGQVRTPMNALYDGYNLLTGVAPTCSLVGVKVLSDSGGGEESDVINGMDWVYQYREDYMIRVASMSLGGAAGEVNPPEITAVNNMVDNGIVVVSSAGNDQQDAIPYVSSPALANKCIAVGSVNEDNQVAYYSSIGDPGNLYIKPDVVAPGGSYQTKNLINSLDTNDAEHIYRSSSLCHFLDEVFPNDYQGMQGTSMAAPHVAGLVGLMTDALDTWDYSSNEYSLLMKMIVCMTACETNMPGEDASPTLDRGGKDRVEGYGIVCADAAIEALTAKHCIGTLDQDILGSDPLDKKVWARQVNLSEGKLYTFGVQVPAGADYDLYLYKNYPALYGDPIIQAKSTSAQYGGFETIKYNSTYDGIHYLVIKWVDGSGSFQISSSVDVPPQGATGVPLFSPLGVLLMVVMVCIVGFIDINRRK